MANEGTNTTKRGIPGFTVKLFIATVVVAIIYGMSPIFVAVLTVLLLTIMLGRLW